MRWLAATTSLLIASPAFAQGEPEENADAEASDAGSSAAELFDRATNALKHENYEQAAEYYEQAFASSAHPVTLEWAIRARLQARQLDHAATLSLSAQSLYPREQKLNEFAASVIDEASPQLQRIELRCLSRCNLKLDGAPVPVGATLTSTIYLAPGMYTLEAEVNGQRQTPRQIVAEAGDRRHLEFEAAVTASPAEPEPSTVPTFDEFKPRDLSRALHDSNGYARVLFWVGAGLTAAAAGATVWSGIDAMNNPGADRVRRECGRGDTTCPVYLEGLSHQRRTNYLLGATAVLGLSTAAVAVWLSPFRADPKSHNVGVERIRRPDGLLSHVDLDITIPFRSELEFSLQGRF